MHAAEIGKLKEQLLLRATLAFGGAGALAAGENEELIKARTKIGQHAVEIDLLERALHGRIAARRNVPRLTLAWRSH
jgi:hypothetical protein